MMNIFQESIQQYKELPYKGCREIVFSNGGHLFACQHQTFIHVFKFFTAECPSNYVFKAHMGHVRSISWLDDDTGFVTSALDATINCWKLNPEEKEDNPVWGYKLKNVDFTCVKAYKPESETKSDSKTVPIIYATGQDKTLREICQGKDKSRFEQNVTLNQIECLKDRRAFFAGVSEPSRTGSVQVIAYPWDKIYEIQAHSQRVERIRISHDN